VQILLRHSLFLKDGFKEVFLFTFERGSGQAKFKQELEANLHCCDLFSLNCVTLLGFC
jgi:hypothetical protein